jgi:hypothetical protein
MPGKRKGETLEGRRRRQVALSLWEVRVAWREPLAVWGSIQLVQAVPED